MWTYFLVIHKYYGKTHFTIVKYLDNKYTFE